MNTIAAKSSVINLIKLFRDRFFLLLKLIVAAGLIFYIVSTVNLDEIFSTAAKADYFLLIAAFLLGFVNLYLQYQKWNIICSSLLHESNKKKIFHSLFLGFSAGVFTPGRIGEYFGRGAAFKDKSLLKTAAATFIDKLFPLVIVIFIGLAAGMIYLDYFHILEYTNSFSILISIMLIIFLVRHLVSIKKIGSFVSKQQGKVFGKINKIITKLHSIRNLDKQTCVKLIFISFLFYSCFLIQFAILFSAFSQDLSFIKYLWAAGLIMFLKTIIPPISIGEFGIREGVSVYILTQMGDYAATAFNASIFLFLINLLFPAVIGLFVSYKKNNV